MASVVGDLICLAVWVSNQVMANAARLTGSGVGISGTCSPPSSVWLSDSNHLGHLKWMWSAGYVRWGEVSVCGDPGVLLWSWFSEMG